MSQEIWKPVSGFEGDYEVSSLGHVRSLDKTVYCKMCRNHVVRKGILLNPGTYSNGYLRVCLGKHKNQKYYRVHRLVAEAFIPNPDDKPYVNHKDLDRQNNKVENLEWVTPLENTEHYWHAKRLKKSVQDRV